MSDSVDTPMAPAVAVAVASAATSLHSGETKADARARRKAAAIERAKAAMGAADGHSDASLASAAAAAAPRPSGLCEFYLARKRRLCHFAIAPPSERYCTHHNAADCAKITCPSCGTAIRAQYRPHAEGEGGVSADRRSPLEQHLLVCPKQRADLLTAQLPFYDRSCNGEWRTVGDNGGATASAPAAAQADSGNSGVDADANADEHAAPSVAASTLQDVPRDQLWALIQKLRAIAAQLALTPETMQQQQQVATPDTASEALSTASSSAADAASTAVAAPALPPPRHSRSRHELQHVAFFALLRQQNLLRQGSLIVEVGAGKAGLSGWIANQFNEATTAADGAAATPATDTDDSHPSKRAKMDHVTAGAAPSSVAVASAEPPYTLVVLDRGSFKHKADTQVRKRSSCVLVRYRIDLQDVRLERMVEVQRASAARAAALQQQQAQASLGADAAPLTLVLGKHVCGQATDFVLKAVARANANAGRNATGSGDSAASPLLISSVGIATCCHHVCNFDNYVNQAFMRELGIGPAEFHLMTRMSTWYTCGYQQHSQHKEKENQTDTAALPSATTAAADAHAATASASAAPPVSLDRSHPTYMLSSTERSWLGFVCKHLLDEGRVRFLRDKCGFSAVAQRVSYIASAVTLEHFMLLAC